MKIKTLKSIYSILKEKKSYLPILQYFLITKEELSVTNLEILISVKHQYPISDRSQTMCIKGDHFIQRIQNIKAPYFITCDLLNKIKFQQPETDSFMKGENITDWPDHLIKEMEQTSLFTLTGHEINTLSIAAEFTADDELRPVMAQVCVDKYFVVASDAHKLYYKKTAPRAHDIEVLFDKKVISLMMLFPGMSFEIGHTTKNMCAHGDGVNIWWRKSDFNGNLPKNLFGDPVKSRYPTWRGVIPTVSHKVIIPLKETIQALDAIKFAINQASHSVKCNITANKMKLTGADLDFDIEASEKVNIINNEGAELEWGMKFEFLRHILKILFEEGKPQIIMGFIDASRAFVFDDEILLMPMMLNA
jgi:hypothetical protein